MEIKDVGTVPYEPPADEFRPFYKRKYVTLFRTLDKAGAGFLSKQSALVWADRASNNFADPKHKLDIVEKVMKAYDVYILFGKDRINEKEFVDEFMKRAFSPPETRKKYLEILRECTCPWFDQVDTNKDGIIDEKEFFSFYDVYDRNLVTTKSVFDDIDANGDGIISFDEFSFALLKYLLNSGPDDTVSSWAGPVLKDHEYKE